MRVASLTVACLIAVALSPAIAFGAWRLFDGMYDSMYASAGFFFDDCRQFARADDPDACAAGVHPDYEKPPLALISTIFLVVGVWFIAGFEVMPKIFDRAHLYDKADEQRRMEYRKQLAARVPEERRLEWRTRNGPGQRG